MLDLAYSSIYVVYPSIRNNRKEKKNHVLLVLLWSIVKCFALNSVLYSSRTCLAIFLLYCNLPEP